MGLLVKSGGLVVSPGGLVVSANPPDCACCCPIGCYAVWEATIATNESDAPEWVVSLVEVAPDLTPTGGWVAHTEPCVYRLIVYVGCAVDGLCTGVGSGETPDPPTGFPAGCARVLQSLWSATATCGGEGNTVPGDWDVTLLGTYCRDWDTAPPSYDWTPTADGCTWFKLRRDGLLIGTGDCDYPNPTTPPTPPTAPASDPPQACCDDPCPCVTITDAVLAGWATTTDCVTYDFPSNGECCTVTHIYLGAVNIDGLLSSGGLFSPEWAALQKRTLTVCPGDETPCNVCTSSDCGTTGNVTGDINVSYSIRCNNGSTQVRATVRLSTQAEQCVDPNLYAWDSGWVSVACDTTSITLTDRAGVGAVGWETGSITLLLEPV